MSLGILVLVGGAIYMMTRLLLAMLVRELRTRLRDSYRFIGPLVAPLHWILLLASLLIGMSLIGLDAGSVVLPFYVAIAWFTYRIASVAVFEWWFATVKGIRLPGLVRRLIAIVVAFVGLLAFVRLRLDVRPDDLAFILIAVSLVVALFFHSVLRDLLLGLSMAVEQRIRVGEWVAIDGHVGQVVAVDWKTTTLQNERRERIVLPNRRIAETVVSHIAPETRRHGRVTIAVSAEASPSAVVAELTAALAEAREVVRELAPRVQYCGEHGGQGHFEASFWVPEAIDPESVESDLRVALWYRLRRRGLIARPAFDLPRDEVRHALRQLPFLASATAAQIETLADSVRTTRFGKGEVLFRQNDRGDELFIIQSGALDISVMNGHARDERIASVGAGSFVGERSLLTGEPRSATARAAADVTVFVVGKPAIGDLLRGDPAFAHEIARIMAERDEQRERLTRVMHNSGPRETASSLLQRIRASFALA